jgi:hypothetical protein
MERERESNSPNLKKYPAKICPAAEPTETDVGKGWAHIYKRAPKTGWKVEASATIEGFTSVKPLGCLHPRDREKSPEDCRPAHRQPVPTLTREMKDNKDY